MLPHDTHATTKAQLQQTSVFTSARGMNWRGGGAACRGGGSGGGGGSFNHMPTSIADLPPEILAGIFDHMHDLNWIGPASSVCAQWRAHADVKRQSMRLLRYSKGFGTRGRKSKNPQQNSFHHAGASIRIGSVIIQCEDERLRILTEALGYDGCIPWQELHGPDRSSSGPAGLAYSGTLTNYLYVSDAGSDKIVICRTFLLPSHHISRPSPLRRFGGYPLLKSPGQLLLRTLDRLGGGGWEPRLFVCGTDSITVLRCVGGELEWSGQIGERGTTHGYFRAASGIAFCHTTARQQNGAPAGAYEPLRDPTLKSVPADAYNAVLPTDWYAYASHPPLSGRVPAHAC